MFYFQSFYFSIFSFPEAFFSQNAAFPEFCALECLISKVFIFRFLASQKLFFWKTLHFRGFSFLNCFFSNFLFFFFLFLQNFFFLNTFFLLCSPFYYIYFSFFFLLRYFFFSQNAAFSFFCVLECLSKVFIFRFLASQKLFSAKRCISGVLHSGISYFQSFHFSIFSFPEAIFLQNAAFPEFCTLERLISKIFIFRFLASQKLFFRKTLHFRSSALWNVLFPKFLFFDF